MSKYFSRDWSTFWFQSGDCIRLDIFRVLFGICIALYMRERWFYAEEWLTREGYHVSQPYLSFHSFTVPLLTPELLPFFGMVLFGSLLAVIVGWKLKWTIWLAWACVFYVTFADQYAAFTVNKLYIAGLAVLGCTQRGAYFSFDRNVSKQQSVWPIRILQMSFLIHYFCAGWQKAVFGDWLTNPFVLYTQVQGFYRTAFAGWLYQVLPVNGWILMQYLGLGFELLAPILFMVKSTRRVAFIWGLGFQLMLAATMHQLIYFMLTMTCYYFLFVDDETLHRLVGTKKVQLKWITAG